MWLLLILAGLAAQTLVTILLVWWGLSSNQLLTVAGLYSFGNITIGVGTSLRLNRRAA